MVTLRLKGHITSDGRLEVNLPEGLESGEVDIVIEISGSSQTASAPAWTSEEVAEMTRVEPKSGAEIVANLGDGWQSLEMSGSEWVEQLRRRRREQNQW